MNYVLSSASDFALHELLCNTELPKLHINNLRVLILHYIFLWHLNSVILSTLLFFRFLVLCGCMLIAEFYLICVTYVIT